MLRHIYLCIFAALLIILGILATIFAGPFAIVGIALIVLGLILFILCLLGKKTDCYHKCLKIGWGIITLGIIIILLGAAITVIGATFWIFELIIIGVLTIIIGFYVYALGILFVHDC